MSCDVNSKGLLCFAVLYSVLICCVFPLNPFCAGIDLVGLDLAEARGLPLPPALAFLVRRPRVAESPTMTCPSRAMTLNPNRQPVCQAVGTLGIRRHRATLCR